MGTYWVIGGKSGIGHATVRLLREMNHVVLTTDGDTDVRDPDALQVFRDGLERSTDRLDGVIYSAGISRLAWLGRMGEAGLKDARDVLDTNLMGFINLMDVLCDGDRRITRPLSVVVVSSDAATRPMRTSTAYCASKAGLDMAVRCAARELGPHGWRINAVAPGMVQGTGMQRYIDTIVPHIRNWTHQETEAYEKSQEVISGRLTTEEVAISIVMMLNPGVKHLNGSILQVNGGR